MQKRALLATYTLLVCSLSAVAGWNTNAWPSPTHWRGVSVTSTAVVGVVESVVDYRTPDGSEYPGYNANGYYAEYGNIDLIWPFTLVTNSYTTHVSSAYAAIYTNRIQSTNYYWSLASIDTDPRTLDSTNTFEEDIGYTIGGVDVTGTWVRTTTGYKTNLLMDVKDLWSWDAQLAVVERWQSLDDANTNTYDLTAAVKPHWYRSQRTNLLEFKEWIADNCGSFVNTSIASNPASWLNANVDRIDWTGTGDLLPVFAPTSLAVSVGAPTNYFDFTPWRNLNGGGVGVGRLVTNTWVCPAGTNVIEDYCGNIYTVICSQVSNVVKVCTNASVEVGRTELDYGWKYIPDLIASLTTLEQVTLRGADYGQTWIVSAGDIATGTNLADVCANHQSSWPGTRATVMQHNFEGGGGDVSTDLGAWVDIWWDSGSSLWKITRRRRLWWRYSVADIGANPISVVRTGTTYCAYTDPVNLGTGANYILDPDDWFTGSNATLLAVNTIGAGTNAYVGYDVPGRTNRWLMATNDVVPPPCLTNGVPNDGNVYSVGWKLYGKPRTLLRFDFSYGQPPQ